MNRAAPQKRSTTGTVEATPVPRRGWKRPAPLPLNTRESLCAGILSLAIVTYLFGVDLLSYLYIGPWLSDAIGIAPHHWTRHVTWIAAALALPALYVPVTFYTPRYFQRKLAREGRL